MAQAPRSGDNSSPRNGDRFARVEASSLADWRAWLAANHGQADSIWLVVTKASAGGAFTLSDAVDQALCFGWIDSLPRKLDATRTMLLFSPRKPGSGWSAVNKAKVERLVASGEMAAPGLAKIAAAKADGSWARLDAVDALQEPADLATALDASHRARAAWDGFPPSAQRGILEWIGNAKTAPTRARRIAETVEKAARGERVLQWRKPDRA